uniref:Uncharacterized protein n=1 Tax=Marseillevirus LCMAC103 TaxID=2506604 RepID=A0A481YVZ6_9VIRU|nr:MAG: hypothetical protein LCMAC103_04310 [Marseillevirus LCMAC103]
MERDFCHTRVERTILGSELFSARVARDAEETIQRIVPPLVDRLVSNRLPVMVGAATMRAVDAHLRNDIRFLDLQSRHFDQLEGKLEAKIADVLRGPYVDKWGERFQTTFAADQAKRQAAFDQTLRRHETLPAKQALLEAEVCELKTANKSMRLWTAGAIAVSLTLGVFSAAGAGGRRA